MDEGFAALRAAVDAAGGKVDANGDDLNVVIGGVGHSVRTISASMVFPRDARQMAWKAISMRSEGVSPVIVAEAVSEGARSFLRSQSIGYADAGGSLFLPLPGAYLLIDRAAPKREKRVVKGVLSGRTSLAAHVIMAAEEPINGTEVARNSGLSVGAVSGAMERLDRMGWLATTGSGPRKLRRVSDRRGLLDQWRSTRLSEGPVGKSKFYVPGVRDSRELAEKLAAVAARDGVEYALSGPYGAQMHAPYLTSVPQVVCRIRKTDIPALVAALGARPAAEGWNLGVIASDLPSNPVFRQELEGFSVASPLVCWVDTVAEGGRNPELAAHLAEQRLL
ncbi:hypothetical protein D3C71_197290 [compost metagenome]